MELSLRLKLMVMTALRQRPLIWLLAGPVVAVAGWLVWQQMSGKLPSRSTGPDDVPPVAAPSHAVPSLLKEPLPGEAILRDYARASVRPEEDLAMMAHALSNLALLVKGGAPFRLGANEEFAAALRGVNAAKLRFLPDSHRAFNPQGQVIDRWQTPLFFHALSAQRIDVRSAGPDRQMWTKDDLHRRYDGQFLRGDALNAATLFDDRSLQPGRR